MCQSVQVRGFKVIELQGFQPQTMIKRSHNIDFFKTDVEFSLRFLVTSIFDKADVIKVG